MAITMIETSRAAMILIIEMTSPAIAKPFDLPSFFAMAIILKTKPTGAKRNAAKKPIRPSTLYPGLLSVSNSSPIFTPPECKFHTN